MTGRERLCRASYPHLRSSLAVVPRIVLVFRPPRPERMRRRKTRSAEPNGVVYPMPIGNRERERRRGRYLGTIVDRRGFEEREVDTPRRPSDPLRGATAGARIHTHAARAAALPIVRERQPLGRHAVTPIRFPPSPLETTRIRRESSDAKTSENRVRSRRYGLVR
jgi:hypothetical protein